MIKKEMTLTERIEKLHELDLRLQYKMKYYMNAILTKDELRKLSKDMDEISNEMDLLQEGYEHIEWN